LLRLTQAAESPGTVYTATYDLAGNRTTVWQNGALAETKRYDAAHQVIGWPYDLAGNLLSDGVQASTYDALNRQFADGTLYDYDGDGILVSGPGQSGLLHDRATALPRVLDWDDGISGETYVYGADGTPVWSTANDGVRWHLPDALGSVRQMVDNTGVVRRTYGDAPALFSYDPWGTPQAGGNTLDLPLIGFTGEIQDTFTGLVYLRAQWYNTRAGTFTAVDPFAGFAAQPYSQHPYQYAYSNPVVWTDPSGQVVDPGEGGGESCSPGWFRSAGQCVPGGPGGGGGGSWESERIAIHRDGTGFPGAETCGSYPPSDLLFGSAYWCNAETGAWEPYDAGTVVVGGLNNAQAAKKAAEFCGTLLAYLLGQLVNQHTQADVQTRTRDDDTSSCSNHCC
jgi:RHS repeat-associated protein